jgi:hypothetical protein
LTPTIRAMAEPLELEWDKGAGGVAEKPLAVDGAVGFVRPVMDTSARPHKQECLCKGQAWRAPTDYVPVSRANNAHLLLRNNRGLSGLRARERGRGGRKV